jgi:hypothetical protein
MVMRAAAAKKIGFPIAPPARAGLSWMPHDAPEE